MNNVELLPDDELIPVKMRRDLGDNGKSFQERDVPHKVEFKVGYYLNQDEKEILIAEMILSDFEENQKWNATTTYDLHIKVYPLTWLECFDNIAFSDDDYYTLLAVYVCFILAIPIAYWILALFPKPNAFSPNFISYLLRQFISS